MKSQNGLIKKNQSLVEGVKKIKATPEPIIRRPPMMILVLNTSSNNITPYMVAIITVR